MACSLSLQLLFMLQGYSHSLEFDSRSVPPERFFDAILDILRHSESQPKDSPTHRYETNFLTSETLHAIVERGLLLIECVFDYGHC